MQEHSPTSAFKDIPYSTQLKLSSPFKLTQVTVQDPFQFPGKTKSPQYQGDQLSSTSERSSSPDPDIPSPFSDDASLFGDDPSFFSSGPQSYVPDADSSERLFPGSPLSVVQAVAILASWFTSFPGMSKVSFSRLLFLLHTFLLPDGNSLPTTWAAATTLLRSFLLSVQDYHACVNDCIVYRNAGKNTYKHLTKCPVCGEPRFHDGTTEPRKRFKYLPLAPRLTRLYGNAKSSQLLQHHGSKSQNAGANEMVSDLHGSCAWKSWYSINGRFEGDPRALSLGLCLDGVNPFAKEKISYSMWPMFLSPLNLPSHLRMLSSSMMLVGIIPGKSEPKNFDAYLDVLVDDILESNQLVIHDGFRNERFDLHTDIMLNVFDYPGHTKVFHFQGKQLHPCHVCQWVVHV